MNNAWVLKPNPDKINRMEEFLSEPAIVAIGWPSTGDLSNLETKSEIKERLRETYSYSSEGSLGQAAGNIRRFLLEMEEGDYVVVPDGKFIHIAQIKSDYYYEENLVSKGYPHQRKVRWCHDGKAISRNLLEGTEYSSLKSRLTISSIDYDKIDKLVTKKKHYFRENSNVKLKKKYLNRLQKGNLAGVNSNTFEDAVCSLLSNYFPGLHRLATTNSKEGDTDLLAELPGGVNVRIQVKYFYVKQGVLKEDAVEQLAASMQSGDNGIIVTSTKIGESAKNKANEIFKESSKEINFIDGKEFVELLFEQVDSLSEEELAVFGLATDLSFL